MQQEGENQRCRECFLVSPKALSHSEPSSLGSPRPLRRGKGGSLPSLLARRTGREREEGELSPLTHHHPLQPTLEAIAGRIPGLSGGPPTPRTGHGMSFLISHIFVLSPRPLC